MMQWELFFPDTSGGVDVGATVMMITVSVDM